MTATKSPLDQPSPQEIQKLQTDALNVLISAAHHAQTKGVFSLKDARVIQNAIDVFVPPTPDAPAPDPKAATPETPQPAKTAEAIS